MSQSVNLFIKGLFTYPNDLSAVPEGALVTADNIYIDRKDVAQPRRGFKVFTEDALTTTAKSLHNYQDRILIHDSDVLQYETNPVSNPGEFTIYEESVDGVLVEADVESPDNSAGLKIKSIEANKNLYFTSSKGIMKIDNVTNSILRSGVPQALDFDLELVDQDGFLLQNSAVAYRIVWGYKDANNNLILGAPSERQTIYYYGLATFIDDINGMLTEIASQAGTFTETYPSALSSTDTLETVYTTMKEIVEALNQESALAYKEYNAGGTLQISTMTCRPESVIPTSSYFIIDTNNGRYVPWFQINGAGSAPNPSLQPDLLLTDTLVEIDTTPIVDPNDAEELAALVVTVLSAVPIPLNISRTDNTITFTSYYDEDLENTVDGDDPTGCTFTTIQEGSELTGAALTLEALQEAYNLIVSNLNADDPPVDPDFEDATTSKAVSLYITIPSDIINLSESGTTFFYQVYRSALFTLAEDTVIIPDDELQQVFEGNPTSGEITAGFVGPFTDETPDSFRAQEVPLYTNPSQEGISQANYQPPLAKDIALYKGFSFFANTINKYNLFLNLITGEPSSGPSDPGFTASTRAILVNQGITYRAKAYGTGGNSITIRLLDPGAPSQALSIGVIGNAITANLATDGGGVITTTATQLVTAIGLSVPASALITASGSGGSALTALAATSLATGTTGSILTFSSGGDDFTITFAPDTDSDNFEEGIVAFIDPEQGTSDTSDDLSAAQLIEGLAQKIVKAINRHEDNSFMNAFYSSGFDDVPGQINFQSRFLENDIFEIEGSTAMSRAAFSPELESPDAVALNDVAPNRVHFSKLQQPEAAPLVNYFDIGAGDQGIIRILASRDTLFVFKEDGIFTISGQSGSDFQVNGLDNTCIIKGPETAVIGDNQIFLFTSEGIVLVNEGGAKTISYQIEDKLLALPDTARFTGLDRAAFGVFYDTEKKYYIWLPEEPEDQVATQCFVYNTITQTWTRLPISKTCGLVNSRDNKLYLGAGDILHVEQERKNFNIYDYADREFTNQILSTSYDDITEELTLNLQSVSDLTVGDAIEQIEYMRPYYFNRILTMLDTNGNTEDDYYEDLAVVEKSEILTNLNALADKLDADPGVADTDYRANIDAIVGTTPPIVLEKFNTLVAQMNTDSGIDQSDFPEVEQTTTFYTYVMSIDESTTSVVVQDYYDFDVGAITTYQAIETLITWAPNHAGNPAVWKHYRECNMLFASTICRQFEIGFASDVSRNFEETTFDDNSLAGWGIVEWGVNPWGSQAEPRPYRTYIPRLKQRSRYLNCQFNHARAFENYLLNGLSLSFDKLTERVTR